ncbi:MAG: TIGR02186 family protein [Brevundimonas sp.]|uniref:TIGR02186 family protein n=1 Tax=Brevundimonas sp. TaxID=1871086 RepID=UPI0027197A39|nr:TIGR02186 family protein [Brevundimonas sp.]MDO9078419.1 TIGR02186 family protein [Brevundimonas sp.]MDP3081943.1 TIGR02186 family protein [Brevundimonas sp.]MDZ4062624.1 TIGR02186 family protein [Brevundimonas sp.]
MQALPPPPPAIAAPAPERSVGTVGQVRVASAMTDARVMIDSSFQGASIVVYGAVFNPTDRPADVVVVVRGPDGPVRLVKKTRNMGFWLNSRPVLFEGAPGFYMTASTRPLSDIADFGQLRRLGVGVDHLRIAAPQESRTVTRYGVRDVVVSRLGEDYLDYRRAVIRLREAAALYNTDPDGVEFVDKGLFRAELDLPAVAPTGQYFAEVWLFQDGEPVSVSNLTLTVEKVGLERDVYEFAHRRPWSYGVLTVLLAALMGWGASRLFRRN